MKSRAVKAIEREIARSEIRGVLKFYIHVKTTITYMTLAATFGMFSGGSELSGILGEIQEEDDADGQPLKSSLVVGTNSGMPGKGYFAHARDKLKRNIPQTPQGEWDFWAAELGKMGITPNAPRP